MSTNAFIPAIEALKSQVAAKELEIAPMRQQLAAKEAEITPIKELVNGLCKQAGVAPIYSIAAPLDAKPSASAPGRLKFREDQFYNKELSEAAVEYLIAKKAADLTGDPTPATVDEIYAAVTAHGYTFTGDSEKNNKSSLRTALTRNTAQIAKIKDDLYGLRKWYGMRAARKSASSEPEENETAKKIFGEESDNPASAPATGA